MSSFLLHAFKSRAILILLAILFVSSSAFAQTISLELPTPLLVPEGSNNYAVGDLNSDGVNDIVTSSAHTLDVLWGQEGGKVEPPSLISDNIKIQCFSLLDFNKDGVLDIAVVHYREGNAVLSVLLNQGEGVFLESTDYRISTNDKLHTIVSSDLNSDELPDFVIAGGMEVITVLNKGEEVQITVISSTNETSVRHCVQIGDFNSDGYNDIITAYKQDYFAIASGQGDGTFAPNQTIYIGQSRLESIATADFNSDGHLDVAIATTHWYNEMKLSYGVGDGTFLYPKSHVGGGTDLVAGDYDGDSAIDIAIVSPVDDALSIYINDGVGVFPEVPVRYGAADNPSIIAASDFDQDGTLDLIAGNVLENDYILHSLSFFRNQGDGQLAAPLSYFVYENPMWTETTDFNNDGQLDMAVVGNDVDQVTILLNEGNNNFSSTRIAVGYTPTSVTPLDINRDGRIDLAVRSHDGISILTNKGNGAFNSPIDYDFSNLTNDAMRGADFNNDGIEDFVTIDNSTIYSFPQKGSVAVFLNNQPGVKLKSTFYLRNYVLTLDAGDFNKDGNADVAVATSSDSLYILKGDGNGQVYFDHRYQISGERDDVILALVSQDLNKDENLDIVMAGDSTMTVFLGDGTGAFLPAQKYFIAMPVANSYGNEPRKHGDYIAIEDVNADGFVDVLVTGQNHLVILLGKGNGSFQNPMPFPVSSPRSIAIGDFDKDGRQQIAVTSRFQGLSLINTGEGSLFPDCSDLREPLSEEVVVCKGTKATLKASGALYYNWYAEKEGGSPLWRKAKFISLPLIETDTFYVSSYFGRCESNRIPVIARVITIPETPVIISGDSGICSLTATTIYEVAEQDDVDFYSWSMEPEREGHLLQNGDKINTVQWKPYLNKPRYETIIVYARNKCGASLIPEQLNVDINDFPSEITGFMRNSGDGCNNGDRPDVFSVGRSDEFRSYVWTVDPPDAGIWDGSVSNIASIKWSPEFNGTAQVSVSGKNGCGIGPVSIHNILVGGAPENVQAPSGDLSQCDHYEFGYFAAEDPPAGKKYTYDFALEPAEAGTIINREREWIQVAWNETFNGMVTLRVSIDNNCGVTQSEPAYIQVGNITSTPPQPQGDTALCGNSSNTIYSIEASPDDLRQYYWKILPEEAGQMIEFSRNIIGIDWNDSFSGTAAISLTIQDLCDIVSPPSEPLIIRVKPVLGEISKPDGDVELCTASKNTLYNIPTVLGAEAYSWRIEPPQAGEVIGFGDAIHINWAENYTGEAHISVQATNDCGSTDISEALAINIQALPVKPILVSDYEEIVCSSIQQRSNYAVEDSPDVTSYIWQINPVEAGQIVVTQKTDVEVIWSEAYIGAIELIAQAVAECGTSGELVMPMRLETCAEETDSPAVNVFPSPSSSGVFTIETQEKQFADAYYEVMNSSGQIVVRGYLTDTRAKINIENGKGLYLIRIQKNEEYLTSRIILN